MRRPLAIAYPMPKSENMMSWVHGAHTLRFGAQIYKNRANELQNFLTDGNLTYNGFEWEMWAQLSAGICLVI